MKLSLRAYAQYRGVSHTAVQKAVKSGRISIEDDGTVDPTTADAQWAQNTRHRVASSETASLSAAPAASQTNNYQTARTIHETYRARLAKLEFEQRSGILVNANEVKVAAFNAARKLRDRLLQIPRRMSAQLAAEIDARTIEDLLSTSIRNALEELSEENENG